MRLIEIHVEVARAVKWLEGRKQYGPEFVGHPLDEFDGELLDAMNYAEEAERQGWNLGSVPERLRALCEEVRAVYAAGQLAGGPYRCEECAEVAIRNSGTPCPSAERPER